MKTRGQAALPWRAARRATQLFTIIAAAVLEHRTRSRADVARCYFVDDIAVAYSTVPCQLVHAVLALPMLARANPEAAAENGVDWVETDDALHVRRHRSIREQPVQTTVNLISLHPTLL